ncbi:MAG TPA: tyrosinase family protein [Thermoanaerobaculia bacterium]|nr:tyrosinase family protein [Thermoanaerobaculia bacterium]
MSPQQLKGGGKPAKCIHGDERFLTWHRLMLWYVERALQVAANDNTMFLPYWNWTETPTGNRYPIEFEQNAVLKATRANNQPEQILYKPRQLTELIDGNPSWEMFAGEDGKLEDEPHNDLHGWVGGSSGPMRRDVYAATDPLFWLFHNYFDALLDRWQRQYNYAPQPNCRTCPLGDDGFKDWTMPKVEHTEDLGYVFDRTVCPAPAAAAAMMAMAAPAPLAAAQQAGEPLLFELAAPEGDFRTAEVRAAGLEMLENATYRVSLYVYPNNVAFAPNEEGFRNRYRADRIAVWSLTHRHHAEDDYYLNVTTELKYLAKTNPGGRWKAALVIENPQPVEPTISEEEASAATKTVTIDGASLVLDRGQEREP